MLKLFIAGLVIDAPLQVLFGLRKFAGLGKGDSRRTARSEVLRTKGDGPLAAGGGGLVLVKLEIPIDRLEPALPGVQGCVLLGLSRGQLYSMLRRHGLTQARR